jgi:hypothetical protein
MSHDPREDDLRKPAVLSLAVIIVIYPILLILAWFILCLSRIVHGKRLFRSGSQHGKNANGNRLRSHGWSPVLAQQGQTNITIRVEMRATARERTKSHEHMQWQRTIGTRQARISIDRVLLTLEDGAAENTHSEVPLDMFSGRRYEA